MKTKTFISLICIALLFLVSSMIKTHLDLLVPFVEQLKTITLAIFTNVSILWFTKKCMPLRKNLVFGTLMIVFLIMVITQWKMIGASGSTIHATFVYTGTIFFLTSLFTWFVDSIPSDPSETASSAEK